MKKFYTVTMMLFFLVSVISAQNLVLNPGFESWDNATTPTDWTHVESVDQESVEVHSGTYSAKHTGGTKDLGQTIPVTGGLTYHLSLWYKVASGDGSDARIWSYWQDEGANLNDNAAELRGPNNSYLPGSTEWQQYSCVVTAPDTATDLYLEVRTYSGAVVYWDDFLLEETAADTEPPVWTAEYPKVIPSHQRVGFALVASMDEPGVVSYVVVPDGSAAPSVAEVIAGVDYGTVTVTTAGTIIVPVADTDIPQLVDAVSEDTDYDVYLVAADDEAVPNTQDAAVMLDVTTILQPVVLLYSGFDIDLTPFTPVSVSGDQVWNRSSSSGNGFAKISGYVSGTSYVNEDWLISPAVDLAAATGEYLSFETANNYGDANTTLKVMISSDFSGVYDAASIAAATWTDITAGVKLSPGGSWTFVFSGELDFSILPDGTGYLAFVYECTDANAGTWEIDNVLYTGYPVAGPDTDPPAWSTDYPKAIPSYQSVGFALVASMDEPGVVSYVVVPDGSAAPSVAEVIAGVDYGTVTVTTAGTIAIPAADMGIPLFVDAVSEDSDYDVYLVAADDEAIPNVQDAAVMLDVSTVPAPTILMYVDFETDLSPFTPVTVSGDQVWTQSNGYAKMTGYVSGTSYVNEDWLISPAVDLSAATGEYLSFETANNYGDANTTLKVMISSDFSGVYDAASIAAATWTDITAGVKLSPGGSWTFVFSGELDFSILPDGTGYMAFVYECTDANAGTWEIDNILYTGYPVGGSDATVTSAVYTVDDAAETITGVLYKSSLEDFEANLVPALGASFEVYEADGTTVATDIQSGYKVLVTAGDGTTTKTYTVTVDDSLPGGLFFSEYIEGSSNNKALEIYNPNDVAVRLDYYQIAQASNGGGWQYYHTFPAGTVLEPGEVWVMITDQTSTELFDPAEADEVLSYPSVVHHNGNDARGLIIVTSVDTTLVDVIGVPDVNPGTAWDVAGVTNATAEHTLVRKNFILEGTDDWALSAGTDAANSQWFVYEQNFFDSLGNHTYSSFVPSDDATVSSSVYIVNDELGTITDVLASEDLETFRANLVPAAGASFEVYEADGTTVATDLQSDYQVIVTAEDGLTTKVYVITKLPLSTDATVSSLVYTVDDGAGTITGVLYKSSLAAFEANLMPADGASFVVYQSDGTTAATDIQTGYKVVVTAEDGSTTKTYTVTVEDSMPEGLFFSEYIEGSSNNKALEVYNPNENPVRLDYYQIAQSVNGTGWQYYHIFPAGAVLEAGDVWVIITDQTDPGLFAHTGADEILSYPSVVHHNGDDARGLIIVTSEDTTLVDLIGDPDVDPGTGWDVAGVASATAEHTLVRKPTVIEGNTDWTAAAGTSADNSEWFVLEQNVFDSLGAHLMTGPELSHDATISDLLVNGTSIPGFTPAQLTYYYTLEAGTTELPVVTAVTNDENAEVTVSGPVNLDGTEAERTATVLITAEDGETTKTYYVVFDVAIGIDNSRAGQIMIYPVPAMDYLNISNTHSAESVSILNITGSVVKMVKLSGEPSVRLDIHNLNSGVYFLEIKTNGTVKVRRFVKD